jgi:hypothetical protein
MSRLFKPEAGIQKPKFLEAMDVIPGHPAYKNVAIAMVAACIRHHWRYGVELDAIILNHHHYSLYKDFVRAFYNEDAADSENFYWHDIQIRKEKISQPLMVVFKTKS